MQSAAEADENVTSSAGNSDPIMAPKVNTIHPDGDMMSVLFKFLTRTVASWCLL